MSWLFGFEPENAYFGNSYFGNSYFGNGGGAPFGMMREKSDAALGREGEAKRMFTKLLQSTDFGDEQKLVLRLLQPSHHLTSPCWTDFNKFVKKHVGCKAKRIELTPAEKAALPAKDKKKKAKAYFIDVTITKGAQDAANQSAAGKSAGSSASAPPPQPLLSPIQDKRPCGEASNGDKRPLDVKTPSTPQTASKAART